MARALRNSPHAPNHNRQPRHHSRPSHDRTQPPSRANGGGFTTIDAPPRRVAGVSHPYGRNSPHTPTHNRHYGPSKRRLPMTWHAHNNHTPPLHARPRLRHRDSATPTGGFTTIDTPPRRVAGVSHPYGRNSPTPDEPKVACNSGARTFYSTPKRCNSNDVMSNLEIHAGELHATFLRNHNMRHHKGPKQKTAQAQKTPTARGERQPPHSRQPCARATTQHPAHPAPRPYTTSPPQHSQTPPRHHPRQRGVLLP